jgi:hypothetical protein
MKTHPIESSTREYDNVLVSMDGHTEGFVDRYAICTGNGARIKRRASSRNDPTSFMNSTIARS